MTFAEVCKQCGTHAPQRMAGYCHLPECPYKQEARMTDEPTKAAKVRMPSIRLIVWVVGIATALTGDRLAGALLVLGFETGRTATTPLKDTRNDR